MQTRYSKRARIDTSQPAKAVCEVQHSAPAVISQQAVSELRSCGYTTTKLSGIDVASFSLACHLYQGQLKLCSKQTPRTCFDCYNNFPHKHSLKLWLRSASHAGLQGLKHFNTDVLNGLDHLAKSILSQTVQAMSLPAAVFDPMFESCEVQPHHTLAASVLEAVHQLSAEDNKAVVDKDILTLLYADSERVLKMVSPDRRWRELTIPKQHMAILAGQTFERATCGLIKAATYCVITQDSDLAACNTLFYRLRSPDSAVFNLYPIIIKSVNETISERYRGPVGVHNLICMLRAKHRSVNALHLSLNPPDNEASSSAPTNMVNSTQNTNMMEVYVITLPRRTISLWLQQNITIDSLYTAYSAEVGRPESSISLTFKGVQLERGTYCWVYGIKSQAILHDVLKPGNS